MQKRILISAALIMLLGAALMAFVPMDTLKEASGADLMMATTVEDSAKTEFKWYTISEALEMQKTSHKKIFMDVYTTWCGPCRMLDANTFSNPEIQKLLSEYYIPVKFNAESGDTIQYQGQTFTNRNYSPLPRKSTHDFAVYIASTEQGLGYPTVVFMDETGTRLQPISGYREAGKVTAQNPGMEPILSFFGTDAYKTATWNDFYAAFQSNIK